MTQEPRPIRQLRQMAPHLTDFEVEQCQIVFPYLAEIRLDAAPECRKRDLTRCLGIAEVLIDLGLSFWSWLWRLLHTWAEGHQGSLWLRGE